MYQHICNAVEIDLALGDGSLADRLAMAWVRLSIVTISKDLPDELRPECNRLRGLWEAETPDPQRGQVGQAVDRLTHEQCKEEARAVVALWHHYEELAARAREDE